MQHFTVPVSSFDQSVFDDGLSFDGSSIRGFQAIHESDMSLFPDPTTAYLDPFRTAKTLVVNFFIHDPITGEAYSRDPRNIARKAQTYLSSTGIGDTAYFAPEAEFYVFDDVRFETKAETGFYAIDSVAGAWNTGREEERGNLGYKVKYKGGYFPVAPTDHFGELRDEIVIEMEKAGLLVERAHHEVGTAGQAEINWRFDELLKSADNVMKFKYLVKNVAWRNGKTATFMPKPIFGDNGSGMHCHQSIWNDGEPLFYDEAGYAGPVRHGALLHRRPAQARPVAAGVHQPDGELLPPAGARLRGADQPGLQPAQPVGLRADPDHRRRTRRPSASSSAAPTRRPTRTSPSPRCCSPASTASRTRSSRRSRSTRTSTSCRRTSWPRSTRCRRRSTRCSTTSSATTTSSPRAACSPPT